MIVTCYYDIYNKPSALMEYLLLFYELGISGLPIIVFTTPELVKKFKIFPPSVKIVGIPINELEIYNICMNLDCNLPSQRNIVKDTKEYFSLMNTKVEFIKRASEISDDETFVWVDFGFLKSIKDIEPAIEKLKLVNNTKFQKITIPGGWDFGTGFFPDQCNWRFNGNLIILPKQYCLKFFNSCKNTIIELYNFNKYLVWEISIWYLVEWYKDKEIIEWYKATHDDSVLLNIPMS
jgi:hypothetical protein